MRMNEPRVQPVTDDMADEIQQGMLEKAKDGDGNVLNIFRTLVNHPDLARRWLVFANHIVAKSTLPARERELAILRIGWLCRSEYEWGQHVLIGRRIGVADDEIRLIQAGPEAAGWTEADRAILRATDDLHRDAHVSDDVWTQLCLSLDEQQRMDLVFTVGQYNMVSMALNSFGVQPDPDLPTFEI
jgi:4-carboxymuconolactone decarboxylase